MTTTRGLTRFVLALAALTAGCGSSLAPACDGGDCVTQVSTRATLEYGGNRAVDILFVVDDTAAIAPHRETLARGFADIASVLVNPLVPRAPHVGFVRAGTCDASARAAACGIQLAEQFARSEWCDTVANFTGTFGTALTCMADLGSDDCGPAQPLAALLKAISGPPRPGWEGFLRPDAYLQIVIVSAADDASGPLSVLDLATLAKQLKPDPSQVLVSIIGPADCAPGDVTGPRLTEFVNQFGANGTYVSLCSEPFTLAIRQITERSNVDLRPPCVANLRDVDADTPGLQPNCTVSRTNTTPFSLVTRALPNCDTGRTPCWRLGANAVCGDQPGRVFDIELEPDWCAEAEMSVTIECLSCADPNDPACLATQ
jgi:hypothetical protein